MLAAEHSSFGTETNAETKENGLSMGTSCDEHTVGLGGIHIPLFFPWLDPKRLYLM